MTDPCDLPAVEQRALFERRELSAGELLASHVDRIERVNPTVNAVVAFDPEIGQATAQRLDDALTAGEPPGPLAALVTAHKDLVDTIHFPTTYGSPVFADHRPVSDGLLVTRMSDAGAVAVGKTNTPEFGVGSHTFNPVYGTTVNPYDPSRSAGGSSGGAAAALACGMVAVADGSDMGGSLRNPAAWNGVVGFRPSPRVVPNPGPGIAVSILAALGPMARTVDDLALLLSVIGQPDVRDPLSWPIGLSLPVEPIDRPLRVAWSADLGGLPVEPAVASTVDAVRPVLADLGWDVADDEPDLTGADECFRTLRAWLYADGPGAVIGDRLEEAKESLRYEIETGRGLSGDDVARAHRHLNELWLRAVAFFDRYDLLLAPVTQLSPFPADLEFPPEVAGTSVDHYLDWMASCCRVTVLGLPALSLPIGHDDEGLPVGLQMIGGPWGDADLLRAAKLLETATLDRRRRPPAIA